jgi:hypothetical protein
MRNIVLILLVAVAAWYGYSHVQRHRAVELADETPVKLAPADSPSSFKCDGRTYCSQMTSCAEATYFLQHCPGTKMDGNHDGVPCEQQWCKQ